MPESKKMKFSNTTQFREFKNIHKNEIFSCQLCNSTKDILNYQVLKRQEFAIFKPLDGFGNCKLNSKIKLYISKGNMKQLLLLM